MIAWGGGDVNDNSLAEGLIYVDSTVGKDLVGSDRERDISSSYLTVLGAHTCSVDAASQNSSTLLTNLGADTSSVNFSGTLTTLLDADTYSMEATCQVR